MNYMILDTEMTYNYGYIIVNEKGDVLLKENLVLTNNFENRKLIGENTYKRKMPIYQKDPCVRFVNSSEGANIIAERMISYKVDQIISHNISEDRRQLELLHTQTGIDFPTIPFYDSINLVKVLYPNNTQIGLEAIISDITGIDVKQTHTALQDCDLLLNLIAPIIEYMPYFIKYQEIFAHDADYETTYKFFKNIPNVVIPCNVKEIHAVMGMDTTAGDKKKVNNFLKKVSTDYELWYLRECIEYSAKTGKALKTPGLELYIDSEDKVNDINTIINLFVNLDEIANNIVKSCISHQVSQETDEMILEKINIYKANLDEKFAAREAAFEKDIANREATFKTQMLNEEAKLRNLKASHDKAFAAREARIQEDVVNAIVGKIDNLINGGLFNSELKNVKSMIKSNDISGLYNYFMNN